MTYLLQVSTCWILFFGIYLLFLRKETFFSINRYYLLGALAIGLLIPYLGGFIPVNDTSVEVYQVMTQFTEVQVMPAANSVPIEQPFDWMKLLWVVYLMGASVVFSRFAYGLYRIYSIYAGAEKIQKQNYTLIESDKYHLPFSFFHYIFISKQLPLNDEVEKVLRHEELHANQWHSIDIVFTELLQVFFWFNPMYKEKSKRSAMIKYLAAVPVLVGMLLIFSSSKMGEEYSKEELSQAFEKQYYELENSGLKQSDKFKYWTELLNEYATLDNVNKLEKDLQDIASEFGVKLKVCVSESKIKFCNFHYVLPPKMLEEFKTDGDVRSNYLDMMDEFAVSNIPPNIRFGKSREKGDPLVLIDGKVVDQADYPHQLYSSETMIAYNPKEAKNKYGIDGEFGAVDFYGLKFKGTYGQPIERSELQVSEILKLNNIQHLTAGKAAFKDVEIKSFDAVLISSSKEKVTVVHHNEGESFNSSLTNRLKNAKPGDRLIIDKVTHKSQFGDNIQSSGFAYLVVEDKIESDKDNFDGRKIIQRNWQAVAKHGIQNGKISIKAEANPAGDIIYTEIIKDETTVKNKEVLKDFLRSAKGYKIEKGDKNSIGKLVFNLGFRNLNSSYKYDNDTQEFEVDNMINLGSYVPNGSVIAKAGDIVLVENEDYIVDYEKGKLIITNPQHLKTPINVTFKEVNDDPIFKVVEEMPRFPGCEDMDGTAKEKEECAKQKMLEFIYSNLKYPANARDQEVEGMVVIRFVVEKDGSITESKILRDIGAGCGTESQRVVDTMPTWIPGKQKGKAVRVRYTLPVKFKLEGEKPKSKIETVVVVGHGTPNKEVKKKNLVHAKPPAIFNDPSVYKVVEKMPYFKGCENIESDFKTIEKCAQTKMLEFIYKNIKYPKEARDQGVDGTAVVQFIVNEDGSVSDATIVRNPGSGTGETAKSIVEQMPVWNPGIQQGKKVKVAYTLPVKFKLEGEKDSKSDVEKILKGKTAGVAIDGEKADNKIILKTSKYKGPDPLFVIDSKIQDSPAMEAIDPNDIMSIQVLKDKKAFEKYGDKGENGVIEITMKPGKGKKKYLIEGQLFGYDYYKTLDKDHIKKERPATKEEKFMRGIDDYELIVVNMKLGYGYNSAYFPGTNTEDGSSQALLEYVGNNIEYPKSAIDNNIEGLVTVRYTVEADGELTNFKIGRSVGWGLDEAVIEMMEKLADERGPWTAAYLARKSVASTMTLPVKFKLQEAHKVEARSRKLNIDRLDISPNPSNGIFNVSFELEEKSPVDIYFYSLSGQLVQEIKQVSNNYRNTIDLSNYSGQTILVNIVQNGKIHTNKVIIR